MATPMARSPIGARRGSISVGPDLMVPSRFSVILKVTFSRSGLGRSSTSSQQMKSCCVSRDSTRAVLPVRSPAPRRASLRVGCSSLSVSGDGAAAWRCGGSRGVRSNRLSASPRMPARGSSGASASTGRSSTGSGSSSGAAGSGSGSGAGSGSGSGGAGTLAASSSGTGSGSGSGSSGGIVSRSSRNSSRGGGASGSGSGASRSTRGATLVISDTETISMGTTTDGTLTSRAMVGSTIAPAPMMAAWRTREAGSPRSMSSPQPPCPVGSCVM